MKKSLSLVVAVYNAVRYLEFIFAALERQSMTDFEVIVADDGSGSEIKSLVDQTSKRGSFPIQHLWHPDDGFRKNVILNRAIEASRTDYLVFIDGDCVPHRHFLRDHFQRRKTKTVLCGRRVNLSEPITKQLNLNSIQSGRYEKFSLSLWWDGLMARSSNLEDGIRIPVPFPRQLLWWKPVSILGCNFSIHKDLLERVNGFDEDYRAPGLGEDSDLTHRLKLVGAEFVSMRYLAVLYHLYHPQTVVGDANKKLFERVIASGDPLCRHGLKNLDTHPEVTRTATVVR